MAAEAKRGCGFRKVGGIYLVSDAPGVPCDRLPFPLTVCPTCSCGIKQTRGWTWIDVAKLMGPHPGECTDTHPCAICYGRIGRAGLLWIGGRFYKKPIDFNTEAATLGISRRISTIPHEFKIGETWVLLAHPEAIPHWAELPGTAPATLTNQGVREVLNAEASPDVERNELGDAKPKGLPGIFSVFKPQRLEIIVTESQTKDEVFMEGLAKRGLTPVAVPDDDPDHKGTVYDKAEVEEAELAGVES